MQLNIKVDDTQLKKALAKAPQRTREALQEGVNAGGIVVQRQMIIEAPKHDGILKNSIQITSGKLMVTIAPNDRAKYAVFVEKGTRPHFVPIRYIEKWARDHNMSPFALQRSIARKGTKANPFVKRTYDKTEKPAAQKATSIISKRLKEILN